MAAVAARAGKGGRGAGARVQGARQEQRCGGRKEEAYGVFKKKTSKQCFKCHDSEGNKWSQSK